MGTNNCTKGPLSPGCLTQPNLDAQMGARNDHPAVEAAEMNAQHRSPRGPAAPHGRRARHGQTPPQTPTLSTPAPQAPLGTNLTPNVTYSFQAPLIGAAGGNRISGHAFTLGTAWHALGSQLLVGARYRNVEVNPGGSDSVLGNWSLATRVEVRPTSQGIFRGTSGIRFVQVYHPFVEAGFSRYTGSDGSSDSAFFFSSGLDVGAGGAWRMGPVWGVLTLSTELRGPTFNSHAEGFPVPYDPIAFNLNFNLVLDSEVNQAQSQVGAHTYASAVVYSLWAEDFGSLATGASTTIRDLSLPGGSSSTADKLRLIPYGAGEALGLTNGAYQVPRVAAIWNTDELVPRLVGTGVYAVPFVMGAASMILGTTNSRIQGFEPQISQAPLGFFTAAFIEPRVQTSSDRRLIGGLTAIGGLITSVACAFVPQPDWATHCGGIGGFALGAGARWLLGGQSFSN